MIEDVVTLTDLLRLPTHEHLNLEINTAQSWLEERTPANEPAVWEIAWQARIYDQPDTEPVALLASGSDLKDLAYRLGTIINSVDLGSVRWISGTLIKARVNGFALLYAAPPSIQLHRLNTADQSIDGAA